MSQKSKLNDAVGSLTITQNNLSPSKSIDFQYFCDDGGFATRYGIVNVVYTTGRKDRNGKDILEYTALFINVTCHAGSG